jgi:hypothetical protein
MSQTRRGSLAEAVINTVIGFGINFVANLLILPRFGFNITLFDNLLMGLLYTAISVARGYVVRRWFNGRIERAARLFSRKATRTGQETNDVEKQLSARL